MLRLTSATGGQAGAAYSTSPITLGSNATFSTTFTFRFTNPSSPPADGITFVLAANPSGLGSTGQGLGYGSVQNSVAVEFDTYNNYPQVSAEPNNNNHIAIDTNGNLTDLAAASPYGATACGSPNGTLGCMANGDLWTVTIGYNGSDLSVAAQDGSHASQTVISNYAINIASLLGTNSAYVGFTGATGADFENQYITTWSFSNTTALAASLVPEPSAFAVLGVAVLGLGAVSRRRAPAV